MSLIFSHPDTSVRRLACSVLTAATANNSEVQKFAQKQGALNLTQHFDQEKEPALKEAIFGSLSSFLKADNFESKRLFIRDYDGLAFLSRLICQDLTLRLQKRVLQLLNDLLMNDDSIFGPEQNGDRFYVRRFFSHKEDVLQKLLTNITESDLGNGQTLQLREYSLRILFWLHQFDKVKIEPMIIENMYSHRATITTYLDQNQSGDQIELLKDELTLIDEVIAAPTRPFTTNYQPA